MSNHLIIGLGGTGGSVIRSLRKRIYQEFGEVDPAGNSTNVDYIYVDSSPADLNDTEKWKTLGASVQLAPAQKVSIHGIGAGVLGNLYQYPGLKSFITDSDLPLFNDLGSLISDGIGGQRRRLGRILFASNLAGPANESFVTRLKDRVNKLTSRSNDNNVTFHICAGLAGGTGSGSIVDAIAQIRKEYPLMKVSENRVDNSIYLYLYVPEMVVADPARDAGFYQANGYAALCELNAMSVGKYRPFDVTGREIDEFGNVKRLLEGSDAFESAYIYTNVNQNNHKLDIGADLPDAVADFIFQKTFGSGMGGKMARLENCENNGTTPTMDENGEPMHSHRFITFGVKRVEYPENEVTEYVAYNFATQVARQMEFRNWVEGIGYEELSEDEVGSGLQAEISKKETLEKFYLTDQYLMLSKPIIEDPSTKKWKDIATAWQTWTQFFAENVQNEQEKKNWLPAFLRECEAQFNDRYRGGGVKKFYKDYTKDIKGYASFIRKNMERILFNDWINGNRSIIEIIKYLTILIGVTDERVEKYKETIAKLDNAITNQIAPEVHNCEVEWNNIGWLRDAITKKSDKVFAQYKTIQCDKYTILTKIEGYHYAIDLLTQVKAEVEMLRNVVIQFRSLLSDVLHSVVSNAESKCKVGETVDGTNKIVKKYNPETVRSNTKRFVADRETIDNNYTSVRRKLLELLGEDTPSFGKLYEKIGNIEAVQDIIMGECITTARAVMDKLAIADPTQKMSNVNILERIKMEYPSDAALSAFVKDLYDSALYYLMFDKEEMSKGEKKTDFRPMIQIIIPEYNDPTNFRQKFINAFESVCAGVNFSAADCVSTNYKPNQIVVIAAASGFPLRYVTNVAVLRKKYDSMMIGPRANFNRMVLHTESFSKPLPPLFNQTIGERTKDLRPYVILAFALGIVKERENPDTGQKLLAIQGKDEDGFTVWTYIGKNILEAAQKLAENPTQAGKLTKQIDKIIADEYGHNAKRAELRGQIVNLIEGTLLPLFNGNDQNQEYLAYRKAAVDFMKSRLADQ